MAATRLRAIVVDDNELVRHAICNILKEQPDIEVVCEAANGSDAVRLANQHQPDLVLMDITMPTVNGFTATRIIKQHLPQTQILVISQFNSPAFVRESLAAGASGFLSKENVARDLIAEIRRIQRPPRQSGSGPAQI